MHPSANTAGGRRVTRWTRETIIEKILEWNELYGEPPAAHLDGGQILDLLLQRQIPPGYVRLHAASRARDLTWPRKG